MSKKQRKKTSPCEGCPDMFLTHTPYGYIFHMDVYPLGVYGTGVPDIPAQQII